MRRLITLVALAAVLALPGAAAAGGRPFVVSLWGANEVPGPGDPDGSGTAWLTLNYGQAEVCWAISVEDIILPAAAAHIHLAPAGSAGPPVVFLSAPDADGWASGCRSASQELIKAIQQSPGDYYVNVHDADYPAGAVRGQLSK
ncbi:MAG: CHRD domain-containing protein [Candidatus Limnocylindrales bacterium]